MSSSAEEYQSKGRTPSPDSTSLVICGEPDYVAEKLHEFQQVYGFTEVLCWTRLGGLDHRKVLRSMELMQDKVIPKLRQSTPPPP